MLHGTLKSSFLRHVFCSKGAQPSIKKPICSRKQLITTSYYKLKSENENIAYERVLVKKAIKYHLTCQTRATWLTKTKGL